MSVLAVESLYVCKKPLYVLTSLSVSLSNLLVQLFSGNCALPLATLEAPEVGIFLAFLERLSLLQISMYCFYLITSIFCNIVFRELISS